MTKIRAIPVTKIRATPVTKLLVQEAFSEIARKAFLAAEGVEACASALTESTGNLHATHRDGRLSRPQFRKALWELYDLWEGLTVVVPGCAILQAAAELCACRWRSSSPWCTASWGNKPPFALP